MDWLVELTGSELPVWLFGFTVGFPLIGFITIGIIQSINETFNGLIDRLYKLYVKIYGEPKFPLIERNREDHVILISKSGVVSYVVSYIVGLITILMIIFLF